jgi:holo-[acyl-carrier protein] synthase
MHPALPLIARIARVEPETIQPGATLSQLGLHTSLGLGILQSALERRFQRKLGPFTWQTTIAQVLESLDGMERTAPGAPLQVAQASPPAVSTAAGRTPALPPNTSSSSGPFGGRTRSPISPAISALGHGVDIQQIAAMPDPVGERAEDPFYAAHFTVSELSGAAARPDAKAHLCGLWCAKEAIRKSDPELAALPLLDIVIGHDEHGAPRPRLAGAGSARFAISLSISHSAAYAVASAIVQRR